jgi:2-pyrone-4,6-dicarboxylate lactonase
VKCDSHFHVFGEGYPYSADLRYKPPHAPLADYFAHVKKFGFDRFVFVQPSAYGRDNACMLDAMREVGKEKCRGIVDIDEDIADSALQKFHSVGVCGVRINVNPIQPPEAGFSKTMLARIQRMDARCAELGWMLDFLTPGWLTRELLPTFAKLKSSYSVAHMGMFLAKDGVEQPGFADFISCVKDTRGWVKLTGVYRMSTAPGFRDAAPFARELVKRIPDRLIWGSDYPHLSFHDKVTTGQLYGLLEEWEVPRERVLGENPRRCFSF